MKKTRKLTYIALLTALSTISVMFLRVPNGVGGIIHPGDSIIYITAIFFGPLAGAFVGGIGHSLANLLSDTAVWAPWTFAIKGIMGSVVGLIAHNAVQIKNARLWIALIISTAILIVGYFIAGIFVLGAGAAVAQAVMTSIQGVIGIIVTIVLLPIVNKILGGRKL